MVRVDDEPVLVEDEPEVELGEDEHAPSPTARMPDAATIKSRLWLANLLM
jgi:hypothetical protein